MTKSDGGCELFGGGRESDQAVALRAHGLRDARKFRRRCVPRSAIGMQGERSPEAQTVVGHVRHRGGRFAAALILCLFLGDAVESNAGLGTVAVKVSKPVVLELPFGRKGIGGLPLLREGQSSGNWSAKDFGDDIVEALAEAFGSYCDTRDKGSKLATALEAIGKVYSAEDQVRLMVLAEQMANSSLARGLNSVQKSAPLKFSVGLSGDAVIVNFHGPCGFTYPIEILPDRDGVTLQSLAP